MNKNRLEAFSDGVIAILITIMVLEIKTPDQANWEGLLLLFPTLFGYLLSFIFIGIYWNNHHHLLHTVKKVTPTIMWTNLNLLFWLSLVPFATKWMDETHFDKFTVSSYAVLLLLCGVSFSFLSRSIYKSLDADDRLKKVVRSNSKELLSIIIYGTSIPVSFWSTNASLLLFAIVAIMWIVPSKKIEDEISNK
jgi:uncharacterized membrane protein